MYLALYVLLMSFRSSQGRRSLRCFSLVSPSPSSLEPLSLHLGTTDRVHRGCYDLVSGCFLFLAPFVTEGVVKCFIFGGFSPLAFMLHLCTEPCFNLSLSRSLSLSLSLSRSLCFLLLFPLSVPLPLLCPSKYCKA